MSGTLKTSFIGRFFVGFIYVMTKVMEITIEKGSISDNHKSNNLMGNKGLVQNLNFEDTFAIAKYDKSIVAAKLKTSWNNKPISVFNLRYFTKSIIGKTWHVLLIYLVLYYIVQVLYQVGYFTNFCKSYSFFDTDNDIDNHVDCQVMIHAWFTHWGETERMMLSCVTFMLGFFVNHVVKRWWDQIIKVPTIEPIIICLSGFVWPNKNEDGDVKSMEIFRRTLLRYCILSWAMAFRRFSNLRKKLCNSDDFISKGLLTSDEFSLLSKNGNDEIWWADRWWVPLIWATNMVNRASNQSQIVPKDAKELIAVILRYQKDLEVINKHVDNQTPILYSQAVRVSVWSFLIFGTVSGQNTNFKYDPEKHHTNKLIMVLLLNFPFQQFCWFLLIFGMLKAAEKLRNPFGTSMPSTWNNKHDYCLDMFEELEVEIWKASDFMEKQDQIPNDIGPIV